MYAWESIQFVLDYIEDHLRDEITIEQLANVAYLSPFYFQRLFHKLVKVPVYEYIRLRRLAATCKLLQTTKQSIIDIACTYQFSNQSNFTRAFKKAYGITPSKMRSTQTIVNQYEKPDLLLHYVMVDEGVPLISDGIVLEVNRKKVDETNYILGFVKEIPITDIMGGQDTGVSITAELWDTFHKLKHTIPGLTANGKECGVVFAQGAKEGHCFYLAGAEAMTNQTIDNLYCFEMPAQNYIVYNFEAETFHELVTSAEYKAQVFMSHWMKKHGLERGLFAVEKYSDTSKSPANIETWLDYRKIHKTERNK